MNIHRLQIGFKCCLLFNKIQLYEVISVPGERHPPPLPDGGWPRFWVHSGLPPPGGRVSGPAQAPRSPRAPWQQACVPSAHSRCRGGCPVRRVWPTCPPAPSPLSHQVLESLLGPPGPGDAAANRDTPLPLRGEWPETRAPQVSSVEAGAQQGESGRRGGGQKGTLDQCPGSSWRATCPGRRRERTLGDTRDGAGQRPDGKPGPREPGPGEGWEGGLGDQLCREGTRQA